MNLQVDRVVQQVLERYGRLDGVVNCVGSVVARSALATDLEELHHTLDVSAVHGYVGCVMIRLAGKQNIDGPAPQLCHPGILTATVQPLCFCLGCQPVEWGSRSVSVKSQWGASRHGAVTTASHIWCLLLGVTLQEHKRLVI